MSNNASLMSSCELQQQWWTTLLKKSTSVRQIGIIKYCLQLGLRKLLYGVAGCLLFRSCLSIGRTARTLRIVPYIVGVCCWGVSGKWGSTIIKFLTIEQPLSDNPSPPPSHNDSHPLILIQRGEVAEHSKMLFWNLQKGHKLVGQGLVLHRWIKSVNCP